MEGSKAYAQHFQLIFSCVPKLHAQHKYNTHVLQSFSLNTTLTNHVLHSSLLNIKHLINHVLQGPPNT